MYIETLATGGGDIAGGDIAVEALILAKNVYLLAGGSIFITGLTTFAAAGEPAAKWNVLTGGDGTQPADPT